MLVAAQGQLNRDTDRYPRRARLHVSELFQIGRFVDVEVGVELLCAYQGGQPGRSRIHQVAGGHFGAADTAIDGGGNTRETQVQACGFQLCPDRCHGGARFLVRGFARVGQLVGDGIVSP
ncbi:hypothetical protein D9M70_587930 [compost metagenome]